MTVLTTPEIEARFWAKVTSGPVPEFAPDLGPCWLWTAAGHARSDHGMFGYKVGDKYPVWYAHRVCYEHLVGPIPDGLVLDHLCRVVRCVRPAHLEPVTGAVNTRRGGNALKTHCTRGGHPLSGDNLFVNNRGERNCRTCTTELRLARKAAA